MLLKRSTPLEATVPTANGRTDERNRLFTTVDCGLSTSTRWISSVIADFGLLPCVLFCESSA
jgi:hypothetical protein